MANKYKGFLIVSTICLLLLGYYQFTEYRAWWSFPLYDDGLRDGEVGDKVIIMAKLAVEDTSWVAEHLSEYALSSSRVRDEFVNIWQLAACNLHRQRSILPASHFHK
jgi:hypothetical protein